MNPRKAVAPRQRADWTVVTETVLNGRTVTAGTELSLHEVRGRVTFAQRVTTDSGADWIDVRDPSGQLRAFRADRVKTVHRKAA